MRTQIGPVYLILGLLAVSALSIGADEPRAVSQRGIAQAKTLPAPPAASYDFEFNKARAFQATAPGMAMPGRLVVVVSDKFEDQVEQRVSAAIARARARRKAG